MLRRLENAFIWAVKYLIQMAPKDTGNLAYNAIKYRIENNNFIIYVDENIAPYMVYTNEPWVNREGINPNEYWWDNTIKQILQYMAIFLDGTLREI